MTRSEQAPGLGEAGCSNPASADLVQASLIALFSSPLFKPRIQAYTRYMTPITRLGPALAFHFILAGCAGKPVIQTQVIEKQIAVPCTVETPSECKSVYAVDRVSAKDDVLTINRALRAEIEERWACEIKLRAALKGCNKGMRKENAVNTEKTGS